MNIFAIIRNGGHFIRTTRIGFCRIRNPDITGKRQRRNQAQILYISAKMGAVGSTVMILQKQLLWVTIEALLFGVVIACFISKKFARPIAALTKQTRLLMEEFELAAEGTTAALKSNTK